MYSVLTAALRPAPTSASFGVPQGASVWHRRHPQALLDALAPYQDAAPHVYRLAHRLLPRLPRRLLASQNLRTACPAPFSSVLPLNLAASCPWIAIDSIEARNALLFDLDHDDGAELIAALPEAIRPWLIIDPFSGRSHAILFLHTPVITTASGSTRAMAFADHAHRMMAEWLCATPLPQRSLVKNPLGRADTLLGTQVRRSPHPTSLVTWDAWEASESELLWHTIPGADAVELRDVVATLADEASQSGTVAFRPCRYASRHPEPSATGRNCNLFDQVRFWAYEHAEQDGGAILAEAQRVNACMSNPLPASEVAATANSISGFMAQRYKPRHGLGSTRGRDRVGGQGLSASERKSAAGINSAAMRRSATDSKIAGAVAAMRLGRESITQVALAAHSGVSLRTVKGRWRDIRVDRE
ncbi:MAG: hypothetical protein JWQ22_166 [Devosia sp.]|nr:hypothetical protein [Devosia sp.]